MRTLNLKMTACAFAAAALLTACGGGGTTPGANNSNSDTSSESTDNNNASDETGDTGTCTTAVTCINFSEATAALKGFEDMEGSAVIVSDPVMESNKVAKLTKTTAMKDWAGASVVIGDSKTITRIDPTKGVTLRVYSAKVGQDVMVKIENATSNVGVNSLIVKTTKANAWETLTFSYPTASPDTVYNKFSVFPAFLEKTDTVFYFDELKYTALTDSSSENESNNEEESSTNTDFSVIINFDETEPAYKDLAAFAGAESIIDIDPVNKSTNVLKGTVNIAGQVYQGSEFILSKDKIRLIDNKKIEVDVYSDTAFSLLSKVEQQGAPASANGQKYDTPGQWKTLTFDFSKPMDGTAAANGDYSKIVFFGNWKDTNDGFKPLPTAPFSFYIDNIKGIKATTDSTNNQSSLVGPSDGAPQPPTFDATNVISLFSNAYTPSISNITWGMPDWGDSSASITDLQIQGNDTKKINLSANKAFGGIDFNGNKIDLTNYTHFRLNYWMTSPLLEGQVLSIKLSNHEDAEETNAIEITPTPEVGKWVTLDVPLNQFRSASANGLTNRNKIAQIVISGARTTALMTTPVEIYFDNMFFYKQ